MGGNLSLEKKLFEQTISKTGFGDHLRQSSHRQLNVKQLKKKKERRHCIPENKFPPIEAVFRHHRVS